jgi:hypothetical protein
LQLIANCTALTAAKKKKETTCQPDIDAFSHQLLKATED